MKIELKPIDADSIPRALEKAERYRLLNEPVLAESICQDILAVEPKHQGALVTYVLALADQFGSAPEGALNRAQAAIGKLESTYERLYYEGLIHERRGHAWLGQGGPGSRDAVWEHLMDAMELYDKAHEIRPAHNDDTTLRWNTCVRLIQQHRLRAPTKSESDVPLE